ncbi:MAG: ABC transporter permease [Chloroflexi bacterium]|nr:ABC transporter permease [Chloroflexota bacterium]
MSAPEVQANVQTTPVVAVPAVQAGDPAARAATSSARRTRRAILHSWTLLAGLSVTGLFVVLALLAPLIAPYSPDVQNMSNALSPPSMAHPFGTDEFGRDSLSRVLFGARLTLLGSSMAVLMAAVIGCAVGLTAGYFGGMYDTVVGRLVDILFAFPVILLGIAIVAILGPGETSVVIAISVASLPNFARISRSSIIPEKEREYVMAAHVVGASTPYIIVRTLLPNLIGPLLVLVSLGFAYAILYEASLSFLGLGARPPTPEWGVMLSTGRDFLFQSAWYAFFPGASIFLLVFSLNLIGDGLRDVVDPHRRTL